MKISQFFVYFSCCFSHGGSKGNRSHQNPRHYMILWHDYNEKYKSFPCVSSWKRPGLLPATLWSDRPAVWLWCSALQCFILSCWMFWQCGFTGCDLTQLFTSSVMLCVSVSTWLSSRLLRLLPCTVWCRACSGSLGPSICSYSHLTMSLQLSLVSPAESLSSQSSSSSSSSPSYFISMSAQLAIECVKYNQDLVW